MFDARLRDVGAIARILVVQTAFLGDVVLTTPLFRALRRCYPHAVLHALVTPQAAPLIEEDPHLDAVFAYDKHGADPFVPTVLGVRRRRYDRLVVPHRSPRSALLSAASGIPLRVGFSDGGAWAYHRVVPRRPDKHEVDRHLSLLVGLDQRAVPSDRVMAVGYTDAERAEVAGCLTGLGVEAAEPLAGVCAGSVWATKRWHPEGFVQAGRRLVAAGLRPVLLGGGQDRVLSERIARGIGPSAVNAAGRTSLKALAAWMDRVEVVITNDSAPLHVAGARGTPTVALFGATTTDLGFGPIGPRTTVLETPLSCRPCGPHGARRCRRRRRDLACMTGISADEVVRAALALAGRATR